MKNFLKLSSINSERVQHAMKTGIAVLLGLLIAKFFSFSNDQWLIIAILVVMCGQISVGGLLQKSYMRFLGTLLGALIAVSTLYLFGLNPVIIALVVYLATILFSYISTGQKTFSEAGTLGAVTVAIILINAAPTVHLAWMRFIQISLGILIALIVSRFLWPQRAKDRLRRAIVANIQHMQNFYLHTLVNDRGARTREIENYIIQSFVYQRNLINEAARESFSRAALIYDEIIVCEREIVRSMDFNHYALQLSNKGKEFLANFVEIEKFNQQVVAELQKIADYLADEKLAPSILFKRIDLSWIEHIMTALIEAEKSLTHEDIQHINVILFCTKIIADRLFELSNAVKQFNRAVTGHPVELTENS